MTVIRTHYEWELTDDVLYGDSTDGTYCVGRQYDRMVVEFSRGEPPEGQDVWVGSLCRISAPRNELGDFEYDLFPDDDENMYVMEDEEFFLTEEEAQEWCEYTDHEQHVTATAMFKAV